MNIDGLSSLTFEAIVFDLSSFFFLFEVMFLFENYHSNHPNKYDLTVSLNEFLIVL